MLFFYIEIIAIVLLCAILPISIFVYKYRKALPHDKITHFIWLLIVFTFELILFGAFTRLTDSGLGCPDWPGCFSHSNPFSADYAIKHAEALNPLGPVTTFKACIEMLHRYIAATLGVLIIVLNAMIFLYRKHTHIKLRHTLPILALIILQGVFGALTVTLKLQPIIVSTHLLLALIFICTLVAIYAYARQYKLAKINKKNTVWLYTSIGLIFLQIMLGAWVSSNYAMLGCTEFPACQKGVFFPKLSIQTWQEAFYLWRDLGRTKTNDVLNLQVLQAIHLAHRYMAIIVFIVCMFTFINLMKKITPHNSLHLRKILYYSIFTLCLQVLTGIASIVFSIPILTVLMHTGCATLLLSMLVYIASIQSIAK